MVTLTNSSESMVKAQVENADIAKYFDELISVDRLRKFKPDLDVYRQTATHLRVPATGIRLIAAQAWDVLGALKAGWKAAFIARPGKALFPLGPQPDIVGKDLKTVAQAILQ